MRQVVTYFLPLWIGLVSTQSSAETHLKIGINDVIGHGLYQLEEIKRLERAALNLGYTLDIVLTPALRSLAMADEGLLDGELMRTRDESATYPHLLFVDEPIASSDIYIISTKDFAKGNLQWDQLTFNTLITVRGLRLTEQLPPTLNVPHKKTTSSYQRAINMLIAGRGDLIVIPIIYQSLFEPSVWQELQVLEPKLAHLNGYLHLNHKHQAFARQLAEELRRIKRVEGAMTEKTTHHNSMADKPTSASTILGNEKPLPERKRR